MFVKKKYNAIVLRKKNIFFTPGVLRRRAPVQGGLGPQRDPCSPPAAPWPWGRGGGGGGGGAVGQVDVH